MSSSIICQNFVQNAWKKELCSNCFKSKDEHGARKLTAGSATSAIAAMLKSTAISSREQQKHKAKELKANQHPKQTYTQIQIQAQAQAQTQAQTQVHTQTQAHTQSQAQGHTKGIIKTDSDVTAKKPKRSVNFKVKLAQVIGFGGEDWSEEEEDVVAYEEPIDVEERTQEEEELSRLTKSNTDFNTNLTCKKLALGKPQMDADGRKQTLLVQVTPFGIKQNAQESTVKQKITMCNQFIQHTSQQDAKSAKTAEPSKKMAEGEDVVDFVKDNEKFKVTEELNALNDTVLKVSDVNAQNNKEKSLLDEITETLEKSKISVSPVKKIVQKEIILKSNADVVKEPPKMPSVTKLTRNPAIKEKKTYQSSKSLNLIIERVDTDRDRDRDKHAKEDDKDDNNDKDSANGGSSLDDSSSHCGSEDSNSDVSLVEPSVGVGHVDSFASIPSRELVGEPDGRAESDGTDEPSAAQVPALPTAPPPPKSNLNSASPSPSPEKPKIPTKPSTILIRKPPSIMAVNQVILSTFNSDKTPKMKMNTVSPVSTVGSVNSANSMNVGVYTGHTQLQKRDSNGSDISKKRKAPKPPQEEGGNTIYMRKSTQMVNSDCPVVREKEKRERASSCTPKVNLTAAPGTPGVTPVPEPAPRRSLSLSSDSLASNGEEKKKRGKFSLKKLLRMGGGGSSSKHQVEEEKPLPKPRLVIVHPLDMKHELASEQEYMNTTFLREHVQREKEKEHNSRPPPPPRNYESYEKKLPPKNAVAPSFALKKPSDSVYANIGEVRSAITPHKPQRTASMREIKDGAGVAYEPVHAPHAQNAIAQGAPGAGTAPAAQRKDKSEEHVYDYIGNRSSSPECDSTVSASVKAANKMATAVPVPVSAPAQQQGMCRSVSMTYCGSETESEIYSPYSYYGSESEVAEDEPECCYGNGLGSTGRTHKLRSKKGRSIVHKNLEDNYGAVVVANHEALAQVLENIQQTVHIPLPLRALKTTENLRWNDFTLRSCTGSSPIVIGNCAFHQAAWNLQNVTLMITMVPNSPSCSLGTLILQPVTEFSDLVPSSVLPSRQKLEVSISHPQGTISVLPHLQVNSIRTLGDFLKAQSVDNAESYKASTLLLLQLVNSLKTLQAQGVEELPLSLNSFVLAKDIEKQEVHARLYILHPNEERQELGTLCLVVSRAMDLLPMDATLRQLMHSLLSTERAVTLSQVKSVLEFSLWGPSDVALGSTATEREFVLQRWLDLQRATVLHGLVCAKVQLTVYEECHLLFLVRSNAKMMCDASLLLESTRTKC